MSGSPFADETTGRGEQVKRAIGGQAVVTTKYYEFSTGEVSGSVTAKQLPEFECSMVRIKAVSSNAGNVYVGKSGVTKVDGTTDITTGIEIEASEKEWFPLKNLNQLYIICDNAGDDITYVAYK